MALANVANWLRFQRLNVAVIDWDLEAPGIESFLLQDGLRLDEVRASPGLMELLNAYRNRHAKLPTEFFYKVERLERATDNEATGHENQGFAEKVAVLQRLLPRLHTHFLPITPQNQASSATGGPIYLLPPGLRIGEHVYEYANVVQGFDWRGFYANYDGAVFFEWFRRELEDAFDVVLIDSRTGITEIGGICTREFADVVVLLCAPNQQNLDGCLLVARSLYRRNLREQRHDRPLRAAIMPARYDFTGDSDRLGDFKRRFMKEVSALRSEIGADAFSDPAGAAQIWRGLDADAMWELRIPYVTKYSYEEKLCIGATDSNDDLAQKYEALARFVLDTYLTGLPESKREEVAHRSEIIRQSSELASTRRATVDEIMERMYSMLPSSVAQAARSVFLRLVSFSNASDRRSVVLSRCPLNQFGEDQREHIAEMVKAGLLVYESEEAPGVEAGSRSPPVRYVAVAYSSALPEWNRLAGWVEEQRDFLLWRHQLRTYLDDYERSGHAKQALAPPSLTNGADIHAALLSRELTVVEQAYLHDSRAHERREQRRTIAWSITVALGLLLTGGAALNQYMARITGEREEAERGRRREEAFRLVARAKDMLALSPAKALETYEKAIQLEPSLREAHIGMGEALFALQQYDASIIHLSTAIKLDSTDSAAYLIRGRASYLANRPDDAIRDISTSIDLLVSNPEGYYERGVVRQSLRTREGYLQAEHDFTRAIALRPDHWAALFNRAAVRRELDLKAQAVEDFRTVAARSSDANLRVSAELALKALAPDEKLKQKPKVLPQSAKTIIRYFNPADGALAKGLEAALVSDGALVLAVQLVPMIQTRDGDVRYFLPESRANAERIKASVEAFLLAKTGVRVRLQLLQLDPRTFPLSMPEVVEVWLPPFAWQRPRRED